MNWDYWLPWRSNDSEDSTDEALVIRGQGDGRIIVNESLQDDE